MKKISIVAAVAVLVATGAQAADLAARTYTKAPAMAQVFNWTGFYAGVNVGGGVGRNRTNFNNPVGVPLENETTYMSPAGIIGGVQIGYNVQFQNFYNLVLGVEADFQGSGQKGSACLATCVAAGTTSLNVQQNIDWFGTVRGRAGFATGSVFSYFTGGLAYGNVNTSGSLVGAGVPGLPFSFGETRTGYVIGSGVEASLGGKWTAKVEYLYVDLGTSSASIATTGNAAAAGFFGNPVNATSRVRDNIFRAGLNYGIGSNTAEVAPANWSGFYVGGNFGSQVARNQSTYNINPVAAFGVGSAEQFSLMPDGYAGGLQIGYNWQAGAWVYGLEADFQGSTSKDNRSCLIACTPGNGTAAYNQTIPYFGTVRGRLGYSVGSTLFYGTGGFAYGRTKTDIAENGFLGSQDFSFKDSKSGYAVGGGIESPLQFAGLFGPSWTVKAEYLFVDLGSTSNSFVSVPLSGGTDTFTTRTQVHNFRTGINYHFNAPVVAKY